MSVIDGSDSTEFIFITSDEPWSDIWHTQLHYGYQLSKRCKVIYIDPPKPWKFLNLFDYSLLVKKVNENLTVIRYKNVIPSFLGHLALFINDFINETLLKRNVPGFSS